VIPDPIVTKRARIERFVTAGKRVGYLGLLLAIAAFVVGAITGFPSWTVTVTIVGLLVGIVVLPVPIIMGYGIRAAERADRGDTGRFH
jgi:hypothetical protein